MAGFLFRAALAALGLWLATYWVRGVWIDSPTTLIPVSYTHLTLPTN